MEREKIILKKRNDSDFYYARISKNEVLSETKDAILIKISSSKIWLSKKWCKPSVYTNYISITLVEDFNYNGYTFKNGEEVKGEISGSELISFLDAKNKVKEVYDERQ